MSGYQLDPSTGLPFDPSVLTFGRKLRVHSVGNSDLPSAAKAVFFDADGTITVEDADGGNELTGVPVLKMQPLPFIPGRVTAMTTATVCYYITD